MFSLDDGKSLSHLLVYLSGPGFGEEGGLPEEGSIGN